MVARGIMKVNVRMVPHDCYEIPDRIRWSNGEYGTRYEKSGQEVTKTTSIIDDCDQETQWSPLVITSSLVV